jgi:hypothetical protein
MRINSFLYGAFVLIVFFGTILGFRAAGVWSTSGKVDASGREIQPSAGDIDSIKGWMTLEQVATAFNIPVADILSRFDLPADTPPTTAIKDLESETFDTTNLKDWLASLAQPTDDLSEPGSLTPVPTQLETPTPRALLTPDLTPTEHVQEARTITGKTTFQDLLDWGMTVEAIQEVIGEDMPAPSTLIKDYAIGKGLEFSTIKSELQVKADQLR